MLDLLIIGAGPSGLACAIEAKKSGMDYLVVDKGGIADAIRRFQSSMYFFSTPELLQIGDVPFVVPTTRPTALDCVNYYRSVCDYYQLRCRFHEEIMRGANGGDGFVLHGAGGSEYRTHAFVIASGYYDTPNPIGVPGEKLGHVSHYYRDPLPYYQQEVTIVGGKNSAVEAALDLFRHGARVTLIHRGSKLSDGVKYWILPDFENRVADGSIRASYNTHVVEFRKGVTAVENRDGGKSSIKTDFAFILTGYRPDVEFLRSFGITVDGDSFAPQHNPDTMETNVANVFVAGGLVGGRFNNRVFIENGRSHGKKIITCLNSRRT